MGILEQVKSEPDPRGMRVVVLGVPGVGKPSFACQAPAPLVITPHAEDGVNTLMASGQIEPVSYLDGLNSFTEISNLVQELRETKDLKYKSIVIDTINGLSVSCVKETCDQDYGGDWNRFTAYGQGYTIAADRWRKFFYDLDQLRLEKGVHVFAIGHVKIGNFANPSGQDFSRYQPDIHKTLWPVVERWSDAILVMDFLTVTSQDGLKVKGKGGTERIIHCQGQASFVAKNRFGLPPELSCGKTPQAAWQNFATALGANS